MRLSTEHYIAINYLALPRRGGRTMQQVADECGVSRQTLYNWLDDRTFDAELKKRIIRNTRDKLPEVTNSMVNAVTEDHNAAMAKLVLQMNDMLTDPINVGDKLDSTGDIEAMQQRIQEYKDRQSQSTVKPEDS